MTAFVFNESVAYEKRWYVPMWYWRRRAHRMIVSPWFWLLAGRV